VLPLESNFKPLEANLESLFMEILAIFVGFVFIFGLGYYIGHNQGLDEGFEVGERMANLKHQRDEMAALHDPINFIHMN